VHHKHRKDQTSFALWLRRDSGPQITFETDDGAAHQAVIRRLDHCFGRGLLLVYRLGPVESEGRNPAAAWTGRLSRRCGWPESLIAERNGEMQSRPPLPLRERVGEGAGPLSPCGRGLGREQAPSPLAGEGWGEGYY
jgi:hypothetical protein